VDAGLSSRLLPVTTTYKTLSFAHNKTESGSVADGPIPGLPPQPAQRTVKGVIAIHYNARRW